MFCNDVIFDVATILRTLSQSRTEYDADRAACGRPVVPLPHTMLNEERSRAFENAAMADADGAQIQRHSERGSEPSSEEIAPRYRAVVTWPARVRPESAAASTSSEIAFSAMYFGR